jgi:hypothetical protein
MHVFGTAGSDIGNAIVETSDGGFALAGSQFGATGDDDMVLLRTDSDGKLLWTKTYGAAGKDRAEDMLLLADGGFLLVGTTATGDSSSAGVTAQDAWLVRTDAQGEVIWEKSYGGGGDDEAMAVHLLPDGGYAVVGYTESSSLGGDVGLAQTYMLRVDAAGNKVWEKTYGTPTSQDKANGLDIAPDGTWVVCGFTFSDVTNYDATVWFVGNDQGDSIALYNGFSNRHDEGKSVLVLQNGNVAVLGFSLSSNTEYNIIVQEIDMQGVATIDKTLIIGGDDNDQCLTKKFFQRDDGTLVLVGYSKSFGKGAYDIFLVAADLESDSILFANPFGGSNDDIGAAAVETVDGGFAVVGYSKSFSFSSLHDIVMLRTNTQGELLKE